MADQWYNDDGLLVRYGQEQARETQSVAATPRTAGELRHMVVDIVAGDLPTFTTDANNDGTNEAFSGQDNYIPAGSYITRAVLVVETAFTSGTDLDIGLYDEDGSAINAVGIDDSILTAALGANAAVLCDGSLVGGTATIGSSNGYVVVAENGTYDAGKAKLLIEYLPVGVGNDVTV